jgi:small nuclear ribonucleoprotein (snRNP)-like protein
MADSVITPLPDTTAAEVAKSVGAAQASASPSSRFRLVQSWIGRVLRVAISDGRVLVGTFYCFDSSSNIILKAANIVTPITIHNTTVVDVPPATGNDHSLRSPRTAVPQTWLTVFIFAVSATVAGASFSKMSSRPLDRQRLPLRVLRLLPPFRRARSCRGRGRRA